MAGSLQIHRYRTLGPDVGVAGKAPWRRRLATLALTLTLQTAPANAQGPPLPGRGPGPWSGPGPELRTEAAYLSKFALFVDWPRGSLAASGGAFAICVVGADPFGPLLDRAAAGRRLGGRAMVVKRLASVDHYPPCQVAFIGGSKTQSVSEALQALHGAPVLTVTDSRATGAGAAGAGAATGVVDFVVMGGRAGFRIDEQAAAESGLAVSSKLLGLAVSVKRRGGPPTDQKDCSRPAHIFPPWRRPVCATPTVVF